jgi:hypothetical protein
MHISYGITEKQILIELTRINNIPRKDRSPLVRLYRIKLYDLYLSQLPKNFTDVFKDSYNHFTEKKLLEEFQPNLN